MALRLRRHGDGGSDGQVYSTPERIQAFGNQHQAGEMRHEDLPIAGIPPVRVEVSIGEASDLCERSQDILENDQEAD